MKEKAEEEALLLVGMDSVHTANCVILEEIWNPWNYSPLPPPLPLVIIPSVITWDLTVQKGLGKCICLAKLEESHKCRIFWVGNDLLGIVRSEVYPLTVLQMHTQLLN